MLALLIDLALELRNLSVDDLCGLGEVSVALCDALLGSEVLKSGLLVTDALDGVSLVLPPKVLCIALVVQIGKLCIDLLKSAL